MAYSSLCRQICVHFVINPVLTCIMNKRHDKNFSEFQVVQGKGSDIEACNAGNNSEIVSM